MDSKETRIYFALLTAGIIFCIVVIFFLTTVIRYQKKSVAAYLDRMKADLDLLEREKGRIAADLHDELGSRLSAVKLMTEDSRTEAWEKGNLGNKVSAVVAGMIVSLRQLSNSMVPYGMEREGLAWCLDELVESLFSGSSIVVRTHWSADDEAVGKENRIHIYRIIQELLSNAIRHSGATHIRVSVRHKKEKIQIEVSDDGRGFHQKQVQKSPTGLGMRNIMARINVMKGSIYLTTAPGKGTAYLIELPACR